MQQWNAHPIKYLLTLLFFITNVVPQTLLAIEHSSETKKNALQPVVKSRIIGPYTIQMPYQSRTHVIALIKRGLIIDHLRPRHDRHTITAYASQAQITQMIREHIPFEVVHYRDPNATVVKRQDDYHTYEEMSDKLAEIVTNYPDIAHRQSLGKTVLGREMWALKISDNASFDEEEPEVKLIATMHGNEIVGQEMLLRLLQTLTADYDRDPLVADLVDNTEIWVIPNMNYDGSRFRRRSNARYVDLNRDFPDQATTDNLNTISGRAIETQNIMTFTMNRHFVLSANFHGGALVANYPWDALKKQMPDYKTALFLAREYAKYNVPMLQSTEFGGGVTNGYAWYPVYGGMQDWNYVYHNCIELTIELDDQKWPSYNRINNLWDENRASLLNYIAAAHRGVSGRVVDAKTETPMLATYTVDGIEKLMSTALPYGDFYRLLTPGTYTLRFSAEGYKDTELNVATSGTLNFEKYTVRMEKKPSL